jgi:cellulose biosynthesis protein BcsQ
LRRQGQTVTLVDFDTHGSSSTWLTRAPNIGVVVQHHVLPLDQGGNRPILDARLHLRRAASSSEVVICDLTWTDSIAGELMFEYDLIIVPTSVSEIELAATAGFLSRHRWVFDSAIHTPPTLLVCPTRVQPEQLQSDVFSKQRFPVSFMLAPPVLEAQSAREMFERGYLMDLQDACGASFNEFGKSVCAARDMRNSANSIRQTTNSRFTPAPARSGHPANVATNGIKRNNLLGTSATLSSQYSILGRHRMQKVRPNDLVNKSEAPVANSPQNANMASIGIPQFLKRMSMGVMNK